MVAVWIREVGSYAVSRLNWHRTLELYTPCPQRLEVLATIVRQEHPVVATAVSFRRWTRIDHIFSFDQDEFEFLSFRCHLQPPRMTRLLIVLALLEAYDIRVELERLILVAHNDGC